MLRSYDFVENTFGRAAIQQPQSYNHELKLAKDAVGRVLQLETNSILRCPGCGGREIELFFRKWDVEYFHCQNCESVFASVDKLTLDAYRADESLCRFRTSEEYQQEARNKRSLLWNEILDWISFRSFRYLGCNVDLNIFNIGEIRFRGLLDLIQESKLCGTFFDSKDVPPLFSADIALSFDLIQQTNEPIEHLKELNHRIVDGGLAFLSMRLGTGFDILVLREHAQIYPYEHTTLLSRAGLEKLLNETGFELLDFSTPGSMDVGYVKTKQAFIPHEEYFIKSFIKGADEGMCGEFQRFLQKIGMSSYAHIVARKISNK